MLKLALKPGDSVTIGKDISVKLVEKTGSTVRADDDAAMEDKIERHKNDKQTGNIDRVRSNDEKRGPDFLDFKNTMRL